MATLQRVMLRSCLKAAIKRKQLQQVCASHPGSNRRRFLVTRIEPLLVSLFVGVLSLDKTLGPSRQQQNRKENSDLHLTPRLSKLQDAARHHDRLTTDAHLCNFSGRAFHFQ